MGNKNMQPQKNNNIQSIKPPQAVSSSQPVASSSVPTPTVAPVTFSFNQVPYQQVAYQQVPYQQQVYQQPAIFSQQAYQIPQAYQVQQIPAQICNAMPSSPYGYSSQIQPFATDTNITQLGIKDKQYMSKKTTAVIVTFCNCSTYDPLFTQTQQKSEEGTKTVVYAASAGSINKLLDAFENGSSTDQVVAGLLKEVNGLDPDCTVFNWECSSGYSASNFSQGKAAVMKFVKIIINRGHMAMFSDFSLKALISDWDPQYLGPNPFVKITEHSSDLTLKFDPEVLKSCPSAQLQTIGDLSETGQCNMHCLGGTIVYSVDRKQADTNRYTLQVLSITANLAAPDREQLCCYVKDSKGCAGHVLLTYPGKKGKILTSMGHWIELMKIDTSETKMFEMVERQYGQAEVAQMKAEMTNLTAEEKGRYVQQKAQMYVQSSAPCNNFAQKSKYNQF